MTIPQIKTASRSDQDNVMGPLIMAFVQDPLMRWFFPEGHRYLKDFGPLTLAIGEKAFENETALYVEDDSGAALWLPPGVDVDEEKAGGLVEELFEGEKKDSVFKMLEEMGNYHPHDDPCWYLAVLGVDTNRQGEGRGALLMKDVLKRCDEDRTLAYLESSNPQNVSFYERHGFEIMGQINCGNPEPVHPMIRAPR
jgi:ribosomal protein S18 acetylase RimI-like enzyme